VFHPGKFDPRWCDAQPVRGNVQDEPHLVGERAAAAGAVGSKLRLVQFDQVLGPALGRSRPLTTMASKK
jgi:hypothetical protein